MWVLVLIMLYVHGTVWNKLRLWCAGFAAPGRTSFTGASPGFDTTAGLVSCRERLPVPAEPCRACVRVSITHAICLMPACMGPVCSCKLSASCSCRRSSSWPCPCILHPPQAFWSTTAAPEPSSGHLLLLLHGSSQSNSWVQTPQQRQLDPFEAIPLGSAAPGQPEAANPLEFPRPAGPDAAAADVAPEPAHPRNCSARFMRLTVNAIPAQQVCYACRAGECMHAGLRQLWPAGLCCAGLHQLLKSAAQVLQSMKQRLSGTCVPDVCGVDV